MQKTATVALINNNKLLLLKRGDTAPWSPNKYCLPGGKLEPNEYMIDAAVRELYEETSIKLQPLDLTPIIISYENGYNKTVFLCNKDCDYVVNLNWEHSDYVWTTTQESHRIDLVPGLRTTIKTLCHQGYWI